LRINSQLFYFIINRLLNSINIIPEINATTGTVITQAAIIFHISSLFTYFSSGFLVFLSSHSLKNHTQNIQPRAIWVELTGKPSCEAIITVIAAAKAIENALTLSNSVISFQTVFIILGQYNASQNVIHNPPSTKIHVCIPTFAETCQLITASYIQAIGQIAFATSFAQCAKLRSNTEKINGIVNIKFTDSLLFFSFLVLFRYVLVIANIIDATTIPIPAAVMKSTFIKCFNHFKIKYVVNAHHIIDT